ncbi:MAG: alpha/beta fold hydrolase [Sandaracinaceae bacterium]|nr:alpha/beta fold hydrolase [Sandaracinaceae bacterium]
MNAKPPVLLVHGIWDDGARFDTMRAALEEAGIGPIRALDLTPNDGSARIERLAEQVDAAARELLDASEASRLDVVGFSMGALVSRFWLQRLRGKERTRRFVSISGPHRGTATAWALPKDGVRQMRPGSQLLVELEADEDPWGEVEVHSVWTPYDLMILPAGSSRLAQSHAEHELRVPMHRWMITDRRAIATVQAILTEG